LFVLAPAGKRLDAWEVRRKDDPSGLDDFCAAVDTAVDAVGSDDAPSDNEWRPRHLQLAEPGADLGNDIEVSVAAAEGADRATAMALADDDARSFITDLVRSGSSITDLDDSPMARYTSVAELYRQGLIEREYLIICRQDHRTLGRVSDMDDDTRRSILQLSCPTCGRRFDEELLRQVHAPSRTAAELVSEGRWRASWALGLLVDHGVDEKSVTQLAGSGGNGTALRVEALHGRLLVELPDAEFGMQHAYALIRRLRRQSIEFGLVLATEPVADEAYQYLSERVAMQQGPMVSVLEGSQSIVEELGSALDEWSVISVRLLAEELIDTIGIDVGAVVEAWMRAQGDDTHTTGEIDLRTDDDAPAQGATVTELSRATSDQ
ncbi:MAG: hypothetical protein KY460_09205, partial [Actinobacteria bacterium]|nr:hypothetical protein [Actinomycetota bacterium]